MKMLEKEKEGIDFGLECIKKMEDVIEYAKEIYSQREEILKAFVAKHGFDADQAEQVEERTENGVRWYIRKRDK